MLTSAHPVSGGYCSGVPTGGPQRCAGRGRGGHRRSCCHGNQHGKNVLENHCALRQALPGCHSSQRHPEHHLSGESHQPQSSLELPSELCVPSLRSRVPRSLGADWPLCTEDPPCLSPPAHLWGGDRDCSGLHMHRESVSGSQGGSEASDSNKAPSLDWPLSCVSPPCCCLSPEANPPTLTYHICSAHPRLRAPPSAPASPAGPGAGFAPVTKPAGPQVQG